MFNHNRLYGVVQMVVHYQPMLFKKAMILFSEIHLLNKLAIISAQSHILMVLLNVLMFIWIIVQVDILFLMNKKLILFNLEGQHGVGVHPTFTPASPLTLDEGASQYIQPPPGYYSVKWTRADGQPFPPAIYQHGNLLQINNARPEYAGTYYCQVYRADGSSNNYPFELRVRPGHHTIVGKCRINKKNVVFLYVLGHPPRITIQPKTINLKEGQRMIVQY
jgi:hypothetical protein